MATALCCRSNVSERPYLSSKRISVSREVVTMDTTLVLISRSSDDLCDVLLPSNHDINIEVVSEVERSEFKSSCMTGKLDSRLNRELRV